MDNTDQLQRLREQIDDVTQQLVYLLNRRAEIAVQLGKAKSGRSIYDPAREAAVLNRVAADNLGPLSNQALQTIFTEIIASCRNIQQPLRMAYLGPVGTYSEEAAMNYCGQTSEFIPCTTIDDIVRTTESGVTDLALVPVENSTEGSVNRTLDLLLETPLVIVGEITLPIHHQLVSYATALREISKVIAHPQALAQCQTWLAMHIPQAELKPASSNAAAVKMTHKAANVAAIASVRAAVHYNVPILAKNIENNPHNTTRFLLLGTTTAVPSGADKTSLICQAPNQPGALLELLRVFATEGVNMLKLESRPAAHALWHYIFYIDIEGHQTEAPVARALARLQANSSLIKIVGSYPKARR